jgi:copper chaperone CopZ
MNFKTLSSVLFLSGLVATMAQAETADFKISGMTCGSCVKAIKAGVCKTEGLVKCDVKVGEMHIETAAGVKIDEAKFTELVAKAGDYKVTEVKITETQKAADSKSEVKK